MESVTANSFEDGMLDSGEPMPSMHRARMLDRCVEEGLERLSAHLARSYLELGAHLQEMHRSRGHKLLGFERWEDYLASKRTYGRTYLSYILRLAQAGSLTKYVEAGLGASYLIEYAKAARDPLEIPALIEETWELVRSRPIREMRRMLQQRLGGASGRTDCRPAAWSHRLRRTLLRKMRELPHEQPAEFLEELREFLQHEGGRLTRHDGFTDRSLSGSGQSPLP